MALLIDSGASTRGWSYYQPFFRCTKFGGLLHAGLINDRSDPLTRGTMGHVGLGHLHARWMAQQWGWEVETYFPPETAIQEWCNLHPEGLAHQARMVEVLRRYSAKFTQPPGKILGVEMSIVATLGTKAGAFGLWVLDQASSQRFNLDWRVGLAQPAAVDGQTVTPACIDAVGAPKHGEPILLTRKLDLVYEEGRGLVCVRDYKCTEGDTSARRAKKYAMDGQFAVTRIMAEQLYGDRLGGNTIQLVQTKEPWSVKSHPVPTTPWRDYLFPAQLHRKAHEIACLERDVPVHEWPMAQHEQVCNSMYEKEGCPAMGFCMEGAGHVPV